MVMITLLGICVISIVACLVVNSVLKLLFHRTLGLLPNLIITTAFIIVLSLIIEHYFSMSYSVKDIVNSKEWKQNGKLIEEIDAFKISTDERTIKRLITILYVPYYLQEEGPNPSIIAWKEAKKMLIRIGKSAIPLLLESLKQDYPNNIIEGVGYDPYAYLSAAEREKAYQYHFKNVHFQINDIIRIIEQVDSKIPNESTKDKPVDGK